MSLWNAVKAKARAALSRFAQRKTQEQAEGMEQEARGIVAGARDLAQREPGRFAAVLALGVAVLWLMWRSRRADALKS